MSAANASAIVESLENRLVLDALPAGPEFRVNTYTALSQNSPRIAMEADGDFVVVWTSRVQDGSSHGIFAQRYDAAGVARGPEFRVNTHTFNSQWDPAVAMDDDGDFVVTWSSQGQDGSDGGIYAQRYNASGIAQGAEFRVNTTTTHGQDYPAVAMDADGDFVIAWQSYLQDGFASSVHAQRFNAAGAKLGGEFRVNTSTSAHESTAAVAMSDDGGFAIAWRGTVPAGAYVQRYSAAGVPQGGEVRVNTYTGPSTFADPSIGMDVDGDFVIVWSSSNQNGGTFGVYGQRFDAAGVAQGEEFHVSGTAGALYPSSDMNADGAFVVTWTSFGNVYAREFDSAGLAQGPDFRVNTYTTGQQWFSDVAVDDDGNFIVAWTSDEQDGQDDGVFAQRYEAVRAPSVTASEFQFETAPQRLRFTFNQDVSASLTLDDIEVRALPGGPTVTPGGLTYDTSTNTATVTFTGILPDANYSATLIASGISGPGGTLPADYVLPFFFLNGDANRDALVNLDDFNVLAANFGESPRTFSQGDFTYDGLVNLFDFNVIAGRFGTFLPPATAGRPFYSPAEADADALIDALQLA